MNNKLSQRKKPKQNNTWSCSTSSYYLKEQAQEQQRNFITNTSIEDRIDLYEHKYKICMQSRTELSSWIKSNKAKGMPAALTEDYSPPSSRSKLFSTRPTAISSLSTFLKKATSYNNNRGSTTPTTHQHHRFSLTSSLNRFSLPKNNCNNVTEKYQTEEQQRRHRFSTALPEAILPTSKSTQIKSSILPHSPSSVFLDKLRPKVPHHETHHNQPSFCEETEGEIITPPSSPSSTGSHYSHPQCTFRQSAHISPSPEKKKKRASLLITPSLSSIRLMSQKSHFLKRQSMLA